MKIARLGRGKFGWLLLDDAGDIFCHSGRIAHGHTRAECERQALELLNALASEARHAKEFGLMRVHWEHNWTINGR